MTLSITIDLDNVAFDEVEGGPTPEVSRILTDYVERINRPNAYANPLERNLRDFNGNCVGEAKVSK